MEAPLGSPTSGPSVVGCLLSQGEFLGKLVPVVQESITATSSMGCSFRNFVEVDTTG